MSARNPYFPWRKIGDVVGNIINRRVIQTAYKGVLYRSRTEARWAVWFDLIGVKAAYEPEGYELLGRRYLPDFYVPSWNLFVEVKGAEPTEEERDLCHALAATTGIDVLIVIGDPGNERGELYPALPVDEIEDVPDNVFFSRCRIGRHECGSPCRLVKCNSIGLTAETRDGPIWWRRLGLCRHELYCGDRMPPIGNELEEIAQIVRSERFGERLP